MDQLTHVCAPHNNTQDKQGHETSVNACAQAHMHKHTCNTAHIRAKAAPGGFRLPAAPWGSDGFLFAGPFFSENA